MSEMNCLAGEGALQAYIDHELPEPDLRRLEQHLSACDRCERALAELRGASATLTGALRLLDAGAAGAPQGGRAAARPRRPSRSWAALPRAAALVLGTAAAAAAAVPGSPVREWLESLLEDEPGVAMRQAAERPAEPAGGAEPQAGVSVAPEAGVVHVVIDDARPGLVVDASLSDERRAWVYASGAATSARFRTGPGRIEVSGATAGVLRVEIPKGADVATVWVGGSRYVAKEGDVLILAADGAESTGPRVTFTVR